MILGVIADDFTGASDIANTLVRQRMSTALLTSIENVGPVQADAGIIALKTRSIPSTDAVAQSLAALDWLKNRDCRQFVFKYCSTFDSTPLGNIGPVAEAIAEALKVTGVICCPAFPANGRTVYQGHLFVNDKLLSESGMEKHPLNPMTDPNIRRWLSQQCKSPIGLIDHTLVRSGAVAVKVAISKMGERLLIADAINDDDLLTLGEAAAGVPLITGGSGIAMGLPKNFRKAGLIAKTSQTFSGISGSATILAGSCSVATRAQIAQHAQTYPVMKIDVGNLMAGSDQLPLLASFAASHANEMPLIYSGDEADEILMLQQRYGQDLLATALDHLFRRLAVILSERGFSRIVVAGGETSGAVVSALEIKSFNVGPEIAPGAPCLVANSKRSLAMALKSGNFGDKDFFIKAIEMMGSNAP